jgi:hypothetical protein
MKKLTSIILAAIMLISVFSIAPVTAGAITSGDYEYEILDDGTAEITGYSGDVTDLEIPSSIDDYTVTRIGKDAFSCCNSITSVTIPDSVTSIGDSAFFYSSLTSVAISNRVTSIGEWAFCGCDSLTSINVDADNEYYSSLNGNLYNKDQTELIQYAIGKTETSFEIPDSVTSIGGWAFEQCDNLISVIIPDSVTSIGYSAFGNCRSLTNVTIGNCVTSIGENAFWNCTSLASITIPSNITSIGEDAFYNCTSLTSVTIPNSVESIGDGAFDGCDSLTIINVNTDNEYYSSLDGNLYNKDQTELIQYAIGKAETTFDIPNSVTSIGYGAFEDCTNLTNVTIPNSITSIGSVAFRGCKNLTSITIPNSITNMGLGAFEDCISLTSVTIPDSVTSINNQTFWNCTSLASITIPNSITSIGEYAFDGCTSLTSVTIPSSVTSIGNKAFGYYYDEDLDEYVKVEDFTIYGYTNSRAERYANENGIDFISLGNNPMRLGDVNGDGKVNITDATEIQKYFVELLDFTDSQKSVADTNGDGEVDIADVTQIQKFLAQLIPSLG